MVETVENVPEERYGKSRDVTRQVGRLVALRRTDEAAVDFTARRPRRHVRTRFFIHLIQLNKLLYGMISLSGVGIRDAAQKPLQVD